MLSFVLIREASQLHWLKLYSIRIENKKVPLLLLHYDCLTNMFFFYQVHSRTSSSFIRLFFYKLGKMVDRICYIQSTLIHENSSEDSRVVPTFDQLWRKYVLYMKFN